MGNLSTSVILLVLAILILWLAVTDHLSNLLDAWDVAIGKATLSKPTGNTVADATTAASGSKTVITLPSLPLLGHMASVGLNA